PAEITKNLASQKARAVASECKEKGKVLIIGADTVVAVDGQILGKPKDKKEAKAMMEALSARSHEVFTGVSLLYVEDGKIKEEKSFAEKTQVMVAALSEEEIKAYIDTEEPYDKAGGYGIQGLFGKHIEGICGDYNNVVGLPVHRIYQEIKA
ncbi:MAG: Maf family protein, partial [Eubacterium sp.]|nr:Maf family protein [Eubacterium sp.]